MTRTCLNCRHWQEPGPDEMNETDAGVCQRTRAYDSDPHDHESTAVALHGEGTGYTYTLTYADHYCSMHEEDN